MENKILQNCGDVLVIEGKSTKKIRNRYYYVGHFDGYDRKLYFRLDSAQYGTVSNPDKGDENGFICDESNINRHIYNVWKNMARRCYDPKSFPMILMEVKELQCQMILRFIQTLETGMRRNVWGTAVLN